MKDLAFLQDIIEEELNEYRQKNLFFPPELYEPVFYTLSNGGKRIRPVLLLMGLNLFDDDIRKGVNSALAVEIFHNFTLLHDDVMDNSSQRRGKPTVHRKWGINTAILSGDAMMIMAYHFLAKEPENKLSSLMKVFNKAALEVCEGQQLDMNFEVRNDVTEEDYLEMIRLKTSVLLAAALEMGAIIGGADHSDRENLYRFGLNLGIAFQLQDDYLDTYGVESIFGKKIGSDIVSNKKTFLLVKALEYSTGEKGKELEYWLRSGVFNEGEKISHVKSIYDSLDIGEITREKIRHFHNISLESLMKLKVSEDRKEVLAGLAEQLIVRNN